MQVSLMATVIYWYFAVIRWIDDNIYVQSAANYDEYFGH